MRVIHRLTCVALASLLSPLPATPWEDVSVGLFNDAHGTFAAEAEKSAATDRRTQRFGEAVALLNVQPRTSSNIDEADAILNEVRTAAPGDDLGIEARYLQGRIAQVHLAQPNLAKAETIFSELHQAHPTHPVGQRAQVKLAVIRLYAPLDASERRRRFDDITAGVSSLTDPGAKVQMHLLLGEVARRFNYGAEQELSHVLAADQTGVIKRSLQVQVLVRIGDLARLTGKNDLARTYYTRFLEEFPRTDRRSTIEGYLSALN